MENKKAMAILMAERLEKLAVGLESLGMNKEAMVNRAKASEIRKANKQAPAGVYPAKEMNDGT